MINEEDIKQKKYCNYCKHFKEYNTPVPQCSTGACDAYVQNITGIGFIYSYRHVHFYLNGCESYEYYPLRNMYGIESQKFIEDWEDANNIRASLINDIREEQLPF